MTTPMGIVKELLVFTPEQMQWMAPFGWLAIGILLLTVLAAFRVTSSRWFLLLICLGTLSGAAISSFGLLDTVPVAVFNKAIVLDYFSFINMTVLAIGTLMTLFFSFRYLDHEKLPQAEYFILLLLITLGMFSLVSSNNLLTLFIALELTSLSTYALVSYRRLDRKANEAALKYFLMGGVASAVMLYGAALIYGSIQTVLLDEILKAAVARPENWNVLKLGIWLILSGFLFKVGVAPFHLWVADVYEGAPVAVTGFMATTLKVAFFGAFIRFLSAIGFGTELDPLQIKAAVVGVFSVCAVLTLVIGNTVALVQSNLKRLLAYSSIAHTGYVLIGLIAASSNSEGFPAVFFYLQIYMMSGIGAFTLLALLSKPGDEGLNLIDFSGLSKNRPILALLMTCFLLSFAGIPPFGGFIGKYQVFYQAITQQYYFLVLFAVITSAAAVFYYLKIIVQMYMKDPIEAKGDYRVSLLSAGVLLVTAVVVFEMGLFPGSYLELAKKIVFFK